MSRTPVSVSAIGDAKVSTALSKFGGASAIFDGSGDWLNCNTPLIPETANWTVEYWYYTTATSVDRGHFGQYTAGVNGRFSIHTFASTDKVQVLISNSTLGNISITSTTSILNNTWYHIAVTRNGNTVTLYINGTSEGTSTVSNFVVQQSANTIIGAAAFSPHIGQIDELRISDSVRYTSNFTPATQPFVNDANTLLLLHMDGTNNSTVFADDTGVSSTALINAPVINGSSVISTAQSKFGGSSLSLNGSSSLVYKVPRFGISSYNNNITVEGWFYRTGGSGTNGTVVNFLDAITERWAFFYRSTGKFAVFNQTTGTFLESSTSLSLNTWYHFAFVKDGTSTRLYLNGVQEATATNSIDINVTHIEIGAFLGLNQAFQGHIDEVRISNSVRYSSNFTPATSAFTSDSNTLYLFHFDGTNNSTNFPVEPSYEFTQQLRTLNTPYALGSAVQSNTQSKFGGTSLSLPSSGSYIRSDFYTLHASTSENFTAEAWIYRTSGLSTNGTIIGITATGGPRWAFFWRSTNKLGWFIQDLGGTFIESTSTMALNTWYHVAVSKQGNTHRLFINGVLEATGTNSTSINGGILTVGAYGSGSETFVGFIDEVRVSNTARYTSTFTPATSAFTNDADTLLLIHADGTNGSTTFTDDNSFFETGEVKEAAASLTSTVNQTTTAARIRTSESNQTSNFNQTVSAERIRVSESTLSSNFNQTADTERLRFVDLILAAQFNSTIDAEVIAAPIEASAVLVSGATVSCSAGRIIDSNITMSMAFNQTTLGSKVNGVDLYAFGNSTLSVSAERTRQANLSAQGVFSTTVDYIRTRSLSADASAVFTEVIDSERSRATSMDAQAAFSFDADAVKIKELSCSQTASTELTVDTVRIKDLSSDLAVSSNLFVVISSFEGADIVITGFASLAAEPNIVADAAVTLNTAASQTVSGTFSFLQSAALTARFTVKTNKYIGTGRPRNFVGFDASFPNEFFSTTSKFGTYSAKPTSPTTSWTAQTQNFTDLTPKPNQSWVYETWVQMPAANANIVTMSTTAGWFELRTTSNRNITALIRNTGQTLTLTTTNTYNLSAFNHIAVVCNGSNVISVYINGSRGATGGFVVPSNQYLGSDLLKKFNFVLPSTSYYLDETSLHFGNTLGFDATSSSITVPTTARTNDPATTQFLYHFERNGQDDLVATEIASANLTATAQLTASLAGPERAEANLTSEFTLTASASRLGEIILVAFADSTTTATATRIKELSADSASVFDITSAADRTRDNQITAASEFTQITAADRTRNLESTQSSSFTLTADVVRYKELAADLSAVSEFTSSLGIIKEFDTALTANAALDADATAIVNAEITAISLFDPAIVVRATRNAEINLYVDSAADFALSRIRTVDSTVNSSVALSADYIRILDLSANVSGAFALDATPSGTIDFTSLQLSEFNLSVEEDLFKDFVSSLNSEFTQTAETFDSLFSRGSSQQFSEFTLAVDANRTRTVDISTEAIAVQMTVVAKIGDGVTDMPVVSQMSVLAEKITDVTVTETAATSLIALVDRILATNSSSLTANSQLTVIGFSGVVGNSALTANSQLSAEVNVTASADAELVSEFDFSTSGARIRGSALLVATLGELTAVPLRIRSSAITTEAVASYMVVGTKLVETAAELNSNFTLSAQVRDLVITEIIYVIPPDIRTWVIQPENRTWKIAEETRTYIIQGD
jgi:hypothetical protein